MVYFGFVIWESKYNTPFTFFEHVEIYALFGRTKWTQNLRSVAQNRFQGLGLTGPFFVDSESLSMFSEGEIHAWMILDVFDKIGTSKSLGS